MFHKHDAEINIRFLSEFILMSMIYYSQKYNNIVIQLYKLNIGTNAVWWIIIGSSDTSYVVI